MSNNIEIAKHLRECSKEVDKIAFALSLHTTGDSRLEIEGMAHRIKSWMEDACEALERSWKPS